jgi:hypothetical protein
MTIASQVKILQTTTKRLCFRNTSTQIGVSPNQLRPDITAYVHDPDSPFDASNVSESAWIPEKALFVLDPKFKNLLYDLEAVLKDPVIYESRMNELGQLDSYLEDIVKNQSRTSVTLIFCHAYTAAILLRWSPSRITYTPTLKFCTKEKEEGGVENFEGLKDFLMFVHRLSEAPEVIQGVDDTIKPIAVSDSTTRVGAMKIFESHRAQIEWSRVPFPESRNLHQVEVHNEVGVQNSSVTYIVGGIPKIKSFFGTMTRVFVACNLHTPEKIYLLKDSWRSRNHVSEVDFYRKIEEYRKQPDSETINVPRFYHGGDVPGQCTDKLQHYRIVIDLCRSLTDFENGKKLLLVIVGGMKG